MTKFSQIVCLVGENPLPIYLGIRQFATKNATVWLVHSEATAEVATRISATLVDEDAEVAKNISSATVDEGNGGLADPHAKITCRMLHLEDPYDPNKVYKKLKGLANADTALNYTGGTKVMSAYGVRAWYRFMENTFYLDEQNAKFYFGPPDEESEGLSPRLNVSLTIQVLRGLHGAIQNAPKPLPERDIDDLKQVWSLEEGTEQDRFEWLHAQHDADARTWKSGSTLERLISYLGPGVQTAWNKIPSEEEYPFPQTFEDYRKLYPNKQPDKPPVQHPLKAQYASDRGIWLELLVENLVAATVTEMAGTTIDPEILWSAEFSISEYNATNAAFDNDAKFESDLIAVLNHRLYYISITIKSGQGECKLKAFEAIHRAQQLGGGLARTLTVTNLDAKTLPSCCRTVLGVTHPSVQRHFIFGHEEVTRWVNSDLAGLKKFLGG